MKKVLAEIAANEKIAAHFYRMRLKSPYLAKESRPGQFVEVRCSDGLDPLLRRPLGVHRITETGIEMLYEVVGKGTAMLSLKRPGQTLDVLGPLGSGFDLARPPIRDQRVTILVAGGIGVAPLVALAEELADSVERIADRKEKKNIYVFIGAKTKTHILCERDFRRLGCRVRVSTEDGSKGAKGLATDLLKDALRSTIHDPRSTIYACGPTPMLKAVAAIAKSGGIACQVSLEERMACGVGVCLGCPVKVKTNYGPRSTNHEYKMVCKDGPVFNAEDIIW